MRLSSAVAYSLANSSFSFPRSVSVFPHDCDATTTGQYRHTGNTNSDAPVQAVYTGYEHFPRPAPRVQPLITFGKPKPKFHGPLTDAKSDMLHAQCRLSLSQWNAGAARRQPTQLITAMCGAFNAVLLKDARDHVQHISDQFLVYTDDEDLAILLNRDTFLPGAFKFPIIEKKTTSKSTWGLKALVVCGYLRRPPAGPQVSHTMYSSSAQRRRQEA